MTQVEVCMPKLSMDAVTATFVEWVAEDGATVVDEQPLFVVETDKAESEVVSPASGVLRHHPIEPGTEHAVGTVLGVIEV